MSLVDADLIEWYFERVAIMELDGKQSPEQARKAAYFDLRKTFGRGFAVPKEITEEYRKGS